MLVKSAARRFREILLAGAAGLMLAACATQPSPAPIDTPQPAGADVIRSQAVGVSELSPSEDGIRALAQAVSSASQVSFARTETSTEEDAALKGALTEALLETGQLGLLVLDAPCPDGAAFDTYASGGPAGELAADLVRAAQMDSAQKTATLADMLTLLRGWNAVNPDQRIRISGIGCAEAQAADQDRLAIFWGFALPPPGAPEKTLAARVADEGEPAGNHIWLVQTASTSLGDVMPAPGWIDLRALPADAAAELPHPDPEQRLAADILFRHASETQARPF